MIRSLCLFSIFYLLTAGVQVYAQNQNVSTTDNIPNRLMRRSIVLDIDARVLNEEQAAIWNETHQKITTPGRPVGIQLVGTNIVVAVQFTPYIRRGGNVLVAQGQIWLGDPQRGVSYYTSIQTIPIEFGEPILFFPLGQAQQLDSSIEIILTLNPYTEAETDAEETASNR